MGYAYYVLPDGREAGYSVEAVCDEEGCETEIDRGLGYLCGSDPRGDEHGCTGYFCGAHLFHGGAGFALCSRCCDLYEAETNEGSETP